MFVSTDYSYNTILFIPIVRNTADLFTAYTAFIGSTVSTASTVCTASTVSTASTASTAYSELTQ